MAAGMLCPAARAAELAPHDMILLDRLTWGINASTAAHLQAVGTERWLDEQLHPALHTVLPDGVRSQIEAMPDVHKSPFDIAVAFDAPGEERQSGRRSRPSKAAQQVYQQAMNDRAKQAASRTILRALYAPDQLRERMSWFWFNHFNVHQHKANIRILVGDYEDRAIRAHALGKFRDLLVATLHHPAMLRYLDNTDNAAGHLNENYAREIMELHTMGVGAGYTQADVEALARILTGVGIDLKPEDPKLKPELQSQLVRDGAFEFNPARHDYGDKTFLGHAIKGRGLAEVDEAIDILVRHPATAVHLSRQIATYFVSDNPPDALVQKMAQTFKATDGDIAAVLSTMVHAPEFTASLKPGVKFKDPVHYVFSAVRLAYDDKVILNTPADPELAEPSRRRIVQSRDARRLCDDIGVLERARANDAAFRDRAPDRLGLRRACSSRMSRTRSISRRSRSFRIRSTSTDCARPWVRPRSPRSIRRSLRRTGTRCFCRRPSSCAEPSPQRGIATDESP